MYLISFVAQYENKNKTELTDDEKFKIGLSGDWTRRSLKNDKRFKHFKIELNNTLQYINDNMEQYNI